MASSGWNRPSQSTENPKKKSVGGQPSSLKGLLAGAIVVVLAAVAYFLFFSGDTQTQKTTSAKERGLIKEVAPAAAPKAAAEPETPAPAAAPEAPKRPLSDEELRMEALRKRLGKVVTNHLDHVRGRYAYSKNRAENELVILACVPVGTPVIGSREYDEAFMKDLQQALIEKTEISPDDPEDIRYYKESVIDMKKQLKQMLKNGEDIQQVLTDTRRQLQDLGVYKSQLEREMLRMQHEAGEEVSPEEAKDFVNAANRLLEEKGIEPFEFNELTMDIIRRKPFPEPTDLEEEK